MDEALIKRIPPSNIEAEQSVIGSMIMDRDAVVAASEILKPEDFSQQRYTIMYNAIMALYAADMPVDLITLQNKLKEMQAPAELTSLEFISGLVQVVPTSANIKQYATIVSEKATLRRLIKAVQEIEDACYLDKEEMNSILDSAEKSIFNIVQNRKSGEFKAIRDVVMESLSAIEAASKHKGSVTGLRTGFYELDYKTAGLQNSDLLLLAARPSMGKTALALNIAENVIVRERVTTAFFSLEMSAVQLSNRLLSMNSRVDATAIRTGDLDDGQWVKLMEGARNIGGATLFIDDTPGITVQEMRSKCRRLKLEHNLGFIIIDYLQLMSGSGKSESRQQEISEISRSLKALAREINCPVLALSQLSRAVEQRPDKRPMLSDLRESGAIEQDADIVMFIYRDEYYNHDSDKKGTAEVIIAKQRNGPTGTVTLGSQLQYTRFTNLEREASQGGSEE